MANVVILGAGISGHTAATLLRRRLGSANHKVTVINPRSDWNWIPSNIWVGVGLMSARDVCFPLKPVYDKQGIDFIQGRALSIFPEGGPDHGSPYVVYQRTDLESAGEETIPYDYLINATGPKLKFEATKGLGPDHFTASVCTAPHAEQAAQKFIHAIERMKKGEKQKIVVGSGHGTCTCQGAAFEYIFNVEYELRRHGVRDKAELTFLTNEYELGDFGIGGAHFRRGGYIIHSKVFAESLFAERGIHWIKRAHVSEVTSNRIAFENLANEAGEIDYDFAMLLPPFSGVGLKAQSKAGVDITDQLFAPNGFMKVDADYSGKAFDQWKASDWPRTYQNQTYKNIFAVGIAFAPPHGISKPMKNKNGTPINPTPPRTGMPSGIMGRAAAMSVADMILHGASDPTREAPFADLSVACVASAGASFLNGSAASMTISPIIPDFDRYPEHGRSLKYTFGEIGLAGHWIKRLLHHMFIYKAQCKPGWFLIPE
ncbi:MAG: NAD(P)/FAD-dependent oxidoreductase [Pseudobdellovibrionaceae bacterium]|nr:NAD(P)/FAD-dependent oxidoreductase [Bdellovibrionales bacterium]USN46065.1 MAG: NAD(P)/FAD-dependent oxidoreductase [Pseudobdellovibrionaceae bacterium]